MLKVKSNKECHCKTSRRFIEIRSPRPFDSGSILLLHWIKASGLKIRPALKNWYLFHVLGNMKSWNCKNNYNLRKELMSLAISQSAQSKILTRFWVCLGFRIVQDSEYILRFWIYFWFWICQDSECARVLNVPGLHKVHNMPE